jgi:phage shock protein A
MTDVETLEERVDTVERAVTDGDHGFPAVDDLAELTERVESLEGKVAELSDRADELEAATQALRGYVGNVRSVNERVEGRADAALAATERLERRLDARTEARESIAAGDTEPGVDRDPPDSLHEDRRAGGPTQRPSGVDTPEPERGARDDQGSSTTDSRDPGVLEQIRSLL